MVKNEPKNDKKKNWIRSEWFLFGSEFYFADKTKY